MTLAAPPFAISAHGVQTILAALPRPVLASPELIEQLSHWLGGVVTRAEQRAAIKATALSLDEVRELGTAYDTFAGLIAAYQTRPDAPPPIPSSDGSTDWEHWLSGQILAFRDGRPLSRDWRLIADLIAFYEVTSKRSASARRREEGQAQGPTMRFMVAALDVLAAEFSGNVAVDFSIPHPETLRNQLRDMRQLYVPLAKRSLVSATSLPG